MLLDSLDCTDDAGAVEAKKSAASMESTMAKLDQREQKYKTELDNALKEYAELREQAADLDSVALYEARLALRPTKKREAVQQLQGAYSDKYSPLTMFDSQHDVDKMLGEKESRQSVRENLQEKKRNSHQRQKNRGLDR